MLKLYHNGNSVCSIKARIVLAEKQLEWESVHISLPDGEQLTPEFLKINPKGVVPVLEHDGRRIFESSIIAEYVDTLSDTNPLMPEDPYLQARTRVWGTNTLEYHDHVNTLTFASYQRTMLLKKPAEELEARYAKLPNRIRARKLRDLIENGPSSDYVPVAFGGLSKMCASIEAELENGPWLMGDDFSLADTLPLSYIYRIECLGLEGLWESRFPRVTDWYRRLKARPSMDQAVGPYLNEAQLAGIKAEGRRAFLSDDRFSEYLS
ncbi:glutathione S-transferase family protein [Hoeflea poritis]|uniref:Glutathione S-transferase family protein n=1 Tax=Hoeflea poritis TaxID=2993659 RepID=A0ABT4VWS1_9HYPH|nr:glutathione S-transferase family protein [Hoeflea poritis]MDA4848655.1 glutathione S-transferase family protein [Hoeflea poritis]